MVSAAVLALCLVASETDECKRLAPKYEAKVEYRLWDGSRVDLLTPRYAIEVDWAPKWAEGIGQCLYYAELTNRKPALMLLVKDVKAERHHIYRAQTVCAKHDIRLILERPAP